MASAVGRPSLGCGARVPRRVGARRVAVAELAVRVVAERVHLGRVRAHRHVPPAEAHLRHLRVERRELVDRVRDRLRRARVGQDGGPREAGGERCDRLAAELLDQPRLERGRVLDDEDVAGGGRRRHRLRVVRGVTAACPPRSGTPLAPRVRA